MSARWPASWAFAGHAQSRVQRTAGGDAREDPLLVEQFPGPAQRVAGTTPRSGWSAPTRRTARARSPRRCCAARRRARRTAARRPRSDTPGTCSRRYRPTPMSVPVVPSPATKCVMPGRSASSSGPGGLVVRPGVRLVAVLVEHHPVGVLGGQPAGHPDRLVGPARSGRGDDLGARTSPAAAGARPRCSPASRRSSGSRAGARPWPGRSRCSPRWAPGWWTRARAGRPFPPARS